MKKKKGGTKTNARGSAQSPVALIVLALAFVLTGAYCLTQMPSSPFVAASDCAEGYSRYDMEHVDFSFCYPESFGTVTESETSISAEARKGTQFTIGFAESDVTLALATADFAKLGDSDVANVLPEGFVCLAAADDDIAREDCFNEIDQVVDLESARDAQGRLRVAAYLALAQIDGSTKNGTYLFVPDVLTDGRYNLTISSTTDAAAQIAF